MKKKNYKTPELRVEDMMPEQMLCDSFTGGGLEDTIDEPIY